MKETNLVKLWRQAVAQKSWQPAGIIDYEEEQKRQLAQALFLWNFICKNATGVHDRREFLHFLSAIDDKILHNRYAKVVAISECLPTSIWRALLWKENIDFLSFESFLRRLTETQRQAIATAYKELLEWKEIPKVIGLVKRVVGFFTGNRITIQKLLDEPLDAETRYAKKGAIAGGEAPVRFGFGFGLYKNGTKDDSTEDDIGFSRFVQTKNHINDFVINQESGLYFWLYKFARSNYLLHPSKKVKLNQYVCPGFWYTIIWHLIFWILSPLLFAIFAPDMFSSETRTWHSIVLAILSLPTPLWILGSIAKFLFLLVPWKKIGAAIDNFAENHDVNIHIPDWVKSFFKSVWKGIKVITKCLYVVIVIAMAIFCVCAIAFALYQIFLCYGLWGIWITAMFLVYIGHNLYWLENESPYFSRYFKNKGFANFPLILKVLLLVTAFAIVAQFCHIHREWFFAIGRAIMQMGIFLFIIVVPATLLAMLMIQLAFAKESTQNKILDWGERVMKWGGYAFLAFISFFIVKGVLMSEGVFGWNHLLVASIVVLISAIIAKLTRKTNRLLKEYRSMLNSGYFNEYNRRDYLAPLLMQNRWLGRLPKEDRRKKVGEIVSFISVFFTYNKYFSLLSFIFPSINNQSFSRLMNDKNKLGEIGDSFDRQRIIQKVINGLTLKKAIEEVENENKKIVFVLEKIADFFKATVNKIMDALNATWAVTKTTILFFFKPINFLIVKPAYYIVIKPIIWLVIKIWAGICYVGRLLKLVFIEIPVFLAKLHERLKEACPKVPEKEVLSFSFAEDPASEQEK